jgi:hypothetical protein
MQLQLSCHSATQTRLSFNRPTSVFSRPFLCRSVHQTTRPPHTDLSTPTHVAYACVRVCVCSSIHLHNYPCMYETSVDSFTHSINAIRSSNLFNHFYSLSSPSNYSPTSLVIPILEAFYANLNMNKKNLEFFLLFCMGVKHGRLHCRRNVG